MVKKSWDLRLFKFNYETEYRSKECTSDVLLFYCNPWPTRSWRGHNNSGKNKASIVHVGPEKMERNSKLRQTPWILQHWTLSLNGDEYKVSGWVWVRHAPTVLTEVLVIVLSPFRHAYMEGMQRQIGQDHFLPSFSLKGHRPISFEPAKLKYKVWISQLSYHVPFGAVYRRRW
jgi:hypothetical protein